MVRTAVVDVGDLAMVGINWSGGGGTLSSTAVARVPSAGLTGLTMTGALALRRRED